MDITNTEVLDLPLGRRNWDDLLLLSSGVSGDRYSEQGSSTASGRTAIVDVHGVRSLQNNFLLDGVDNNSTSENVLELSAETVHESVDAIQEFRLITDPYSAEYGRSPGAAIVVATKGGTDKFHGTGWEFVRNNKFDSTDFFTNRSGEHKEQVRPEPVRGQHWRADKERQSLLLLQLRGPTPRAGDTDLLSNVPTASERIGNFSAAAATLNRTTYKTISDPVGDCKAKDPTAINANNTFVNNVIPTDLPGHGIAEDSSLTFPCPTSLPRPGRSTPTTFIIPRPCLTTVTRTPLALTPKSRPTTTRSCGIAYCLAIGMPLAPSTPPSLTAPARRPSESITSIPKERRWAMTGSSARRC